MNKAVKTILSISVSRNNILSDEQKKILIRLKIIFKELKGPFDHMPGSFNTNQLWYETPAFVFPMDNNLDIFAIAASDSAFINYLFYKNKIDLNVKLIYKEDTEEEKLIPLDFSLPEEEITYMPYPYYSRKLAVLGEMNILYANGIE